MALCTAALVCVAASNGGTISQDLKTGFLVGATPWAQQIAIMVGVATSALVIGWTLLYLNEAATTYAVRSYPDFVATDEGVRELTSTDPARVAFGSRLQEFRGTPYRVLYVRKPTHGVPTGKYLVGSDGRIAYLVDPGVCGVEPEQLGADGRVEKTVSKFDAPKAQLFRLIIDGVLGGDLPWALVLVGVALALLVELCGVPSLPFAVGAYLPFSTSTSIALGGAVRWLADRRSSAEGDPTDSAPGALFSSGLIAGGAIAGLFYAALAGIETTAKDASGAMRPVPLLEGWGLVLSHRLLGAEAARRLETSAAWSIVPFIALAAALLWVARRPRSRFPSS